MPEGPEVRLRAEMARLAREFRRELPDRLAELDLLLAAAGRPEGLARLRHLARRLSEGAAVHGLRDLAGTARALAVAAEQLGRGETLPKGALEALMGALHRHPGTEGDTEGPTGTPPADMASDLFLLAGGAGTLLGLAEHLQSFDLTLRRFLSAGDLFEALGEREPFALLVSEEALADADWDRLQIHQAGRLHAIPLIVLDGRPDLFRRVRALRAGAVRYLLEPVDPLAVLEALDAHLPNLGQDPHRILVMEEDPLQAAHTRAVLEGAGMRVDAVADPLDLMERMSAFRPDLVLMDLFMPHCTGLELGAVIRQEPAHVGVPIVYLSGEEAADLQLSALSLGGDDVLSKPLDAESLVAVVRARAKRGRILRGHMVRDSLTGFLNHGAILAQLHLEVARAHRQRGALTFAMLDLDHFKEVNDRFGHAAGDQVLRSLARLLQRRLRRTDILGRYGGEEFALVLPDTDLEAAVHVLDMVRQAFADLCFPFAGGMGHLSFSVGLAAFPEVPDAEALALAADAALYVAKAQGRNRLAIHPCGGA